MSRTSVIDQALVHLYLRILRLRTLQRNFDQLPAVVVVAAEAAKAEVAYSSKACSQQGDICRFSNLQGRRQLPSIKPVRHKARGQAAESVYPPPSPLACLFMWAMGSRLPVTRPTMTSWRDDSSCNAAGASGSSGHTHKIL